MTAIQRVGMASLQKNGNKGSHCWGREVSQFSQHFGTAVKAPPLVGCVVWAPTLAHTSLLIKVGALPDSKYKSSILVDYASCGMPDLVLGPANGVILPRMEMHTHP